MNYTELEARLDADLQAARDAGFKIVRDSFGGSAKMECCAISAGGFLEENELADLNPTAEAGQRLCLTWDQVDSIVSGFDGGKMPLCGDRQLYLIGQRLADTYIHEPRETPIA